MADDYNTTILKMRQERAQRERVAELQEIQRSHYDAKKNRDEAAARGDVAEFEDWDNHCQNLEAQWQQLNPPQPPQADPRWVRWVQRNPGFAERFGNRAAEAVSGALAYMMRRKDPNTNNPALTGMGMTAEQIMTPQGLDKLETILQMHGPMYYNVTYDPGEKSLTPNAAAKLSGLSVESYNRGVHAMHRQGRLGIYKR